MAGHSHASNIKHKKGRNDKLRSELFLKIRKKIEFAYSSSGDREKIFSLAREHNFPKEKVGLIIEKIEKSRHQSSTFIELLYRGKYEILVYLRGNLPSHWEDLLRENIKTLSLEKLHSKGSQDYFSPLYLLIMNSHQNIEEVVLSSLSPLVIDKIVKIEKKEGVGESEFKIFFSEKGVLTEAIKFFTNYLNTDKLGVQEVFDPLLPIDADSDEFLIYLSLLENSFAKFAGSLQVFTNVSSRKVGP